MTNKRKITGVCEFTYNLYFEFAQSAGAVEYTDWTSAEG